MSRFLLVTWDGAGNLPPERAIVRALVQQGHCVHALAHESVRADLERDGADWVAVPGLRHYDSKEEMSRELEMRFILEEIWYARAFGAALLDTVDRLKPDALLVDVSLVPALVASRRTGLPTAVLCHMPYQLITGMFAPLFASRLAETNTYATELGLAPFASHQALIEASPVLIASYLPFDVLDERSSNLVHVGPCRSRQSPGERWPRFGDGRPKVVVGLSTSHQSQLPLLQRICDALEPLELAALITTGPAIDPRALRVGSNTAVEEFIPHDVVLPAADLLITHAGHGTAMAGLTYGVPMLCFPMGRDQPWIAARVAELGLGSVASADASVAQIREAIAMVLSDARTPQRARQFAQSLVAHPGLESAVRIVEELAANGT